MIIDYRPDWLPLRRLPVLVRVFAVRLRVPACATVRAREVVDLERVPPVVRLPVFAGGVVESERVPVLAFVLAPLLARERAPAARVRVPEVERERVPVERFRVRLLPSLIS
jgi:hypothetical protein